MKFNNNAQFTCKPEEWVVGGEFCEKFLLCNILQGNFLAEQ